MWTPICLTALVLIASIYSGIAKSPKNCDSRIAKCEQRLNTRSKVNPICGSNNQTYSSRCALLREHCLAGDVTLKHRGKCRDRQPCWSRQNNDNDAACLPDGRFAPVQCHKATGYCWCVTPRGRPIPNTSRRKSKPKCNKHRKSRRGMESRSKKQNKECSTVDRAAYINNMVQIFSVEYVKNITNIPKTEDTILQWQFKRLDVNGDGVLSLNEYSELRQMVRKVVRPKRCSRTFSKACDSNNDLNITHQEWDSCLSLHIDDILDENPEEEVISDIVGGMSLLLNEDTNDHKKEPEINNCSTDRKTALDEQQIISMDMYVPECTPDGLYEKIQCYTSTGYCWCVQEDTGKPIPGTSVKDLHPKCDAIPATTRPMEGCPEHKKRVFMNDILDFMMKSMASQKLKENITTTESTQNTEKQNVLTWMFTKLDENNNQVLEKKEWKTFRNMIAPHKNLRQCGKKLPRYCDINQDRKVTVSEFINCLNHTNTNTFSSSSALNQASERRGKISPLEQYLKSD